ncbi:MAG TPA: choice-of-anchor P family protein [Acidimicrobiia bacterium]|nr:choice-of-anchor P family protein [Acidimicrobiia bacterium]
MKVRDMRLRRHGVVAIAVLGLMASAVVPAAAERGGGGGGGLGGTAKAAAFALDVDVDVLGALPLDVGPLARLRLSGDAGPRYANVAKVQVPPLLEALVLATGAQTKMAHGAYSKASARVATVKLHLLGDLLVKLLKSGCEVSSDGVNIESDIVFADGSILNGLVGADMLALAARPNSRLSVPLIGDLILNEQKVEKTSGAHGNQVTVTVNALHLVLNGILGKGDVTVAQSVCRASGKNIGKELKVVSTTNGNDTSGQVGEGDGDGSGSGLLDGILGGDDGGLLGVNHLLGGGLLNGGVL